MNATAVASGPLSVLESVPGILETCDTLIIVSRVEDLQGLVPGQPGELVFSTDWLTWRHWCNLGGHGIHFEYFLNDWVPNEAIGHFIDGVDWMYVNGTDITLFDGVSLGKQFNWEVVAAHHAFRRISHALDQALRQVQAKRIVVRSMRAEYGLLDRQVQALLIDAVAQHHGVDVAYDPQAEATAVALVPEYPFNRESPEEPRAKAVARALYEWVTDFVFQTIDWFRPRRPRSLIFNNPLIIHALLQEAGNLKVQPVLFAGMLPKRLSFLWHCLKNGVRLAALPVPTLDGKSLDRLKAMECQLEDFWERTPPRDAAQAAMRLFVRNNILRPGLFRSRAVEILRMGRFLRRLRVRHVMIGDSENQTCRLLLELAMRDGLHRDELLNGMFVSTQQVDARTGDANNPALVQRLLAWNASNELWVRLTRAPLNTVRTGYPVVEWLRRQAPPPPSGKGNVLILPLHIDRNDPAGLYGEVYAYLIQVIRALKQGGYENFRVKVHPGFHNIEYYRCALQMHGIECALFKDGHLAEHIAWSDFVVGPINSGAFVETLAAGRDYFPMRNVPSSIRPELFHPVIVADNAQALMIMIKNNPNDRINTLKEFFGWDPTLSAANKVWRAIEESVNNA